MRPYRTLANLVALVSIMTLSAVQSVRADFPEAGELPSHPGLPDPLVSLTGQRISTKEDWLQKRRPELKGLFENYMYGTIPAPVKIEAKIERVDPKALGGKATLKEITISLGDAKVPKLHVLLVIPNKRTGPAPVFLGLNFSGNHAVLSDPAIHIPKALLEGKGALRGKGIDTWAIEQSIDRGYAVATLFNGDAVPDKADGRSEGIQPHFGNQDPNSWAAVAAWAWALQRVVDYLATDTDIDVTRIIVVGHSRFGKVALLAGAFDERIAIIIPLQAGCGGTAPSRGTIGESVKQINDRFPHWFNANFKKFNTQTDKIPFDQHCLVAICAPRPVLFANATEDTWANPEGQFQMLRAADPVYRLMGVEGISAKEMPEVGKLIDSRLGYFLRAGKHSMSPVDWRAFADFADKHLSKVSKKD